MRFSDGMGTDGMKRGTHRRLIRIALLLFLVPAGLAAQETDELEVRLQTRLQAKLDSLAMKPALPGMTLGVVVSDGISFALAAGMADTARHVAMSPDARMLLGSVGKTYFGAVALQLVAEGRIDLDAHIEEYLGDEPWFDRIPNAHDVTVRQLMNHTSGIVRYEFSPGFTQAFSDDPMRTFTPEERLSYLFDTEAPFAAGEGWEYSDTNYILVAMIIEKVTGNTAYDEIRSRILEPKGFVNTMPSDRPDIPGISQAYAGPSNPFGGFDEMVVDGRLVINPQFEWGGGGMAATAEDLARWTREIQEGRAFDPALLEEYRTGHEAPLGPQGRYGLGVIMMRLAAGPAWGHSGFMPGYLTETYYFPESGFSLALLINTTSRAAFPPPPIRMVNQLAMIVAEELGAEQ